MALNDKKINFDINKRNIFNLTSKQFDTTGARSFTFRLLKDSIPFNLEGLFVKVGGKKPDGKNILNDCKILDYKKGLVEVELTTQMQVKAGILNLELIIFKESTRLSTVPFEVKIIQSATCYEEVQSSDEFGALNNALDRVTQYTAKIDSKANESDLVIERKRIDSLVSLPEGSTTGDAELVDIRIGADSVHYSNAGESVRGQFKRNNENLKLANIEALPNVPARNGAYEINGNFTENEDYRLSKVIKLDYGESLLVNCESRASVINLVNSTGSFIKSLAYGEMPCEFKCLDKNGCYVNYGWRISSPVYAVKVKDFSIERFDEMAQINDEFFKAVFTPGKYIDASASEGTDPSRCSTDYISCGENLKVKVKGESDHSNVSLVTFYDSKKQAIQTNCNLGDRVNEYTFVSPLGTRFLRASGKVTDNNYVKLVDCAVNIYSQITNLGEEIDARSFEKRLDLNINFTKGKYIEYGLSNIGKRWDSVVIENPTSYYTDSLVDVSKYVGSRIKIVMSDYSKLSMRAICQCDRNGIIKMIHAEKLLEFEKNYKGFYEADIKIEFPYLAISLSSKPLSISIISTPLDSFVIGDVDKIAYVSVSGDDSNIGTVNSPYATVNKAIEDGFTDIMIFEGKYNQRIDLSKLKGKALSLTSYKKDGRVVFTHGESLISTSEEKVHEKTKVYSIPVSSSKIDSYTKWLYQDGVNDETTLISDEERHPLQRGYKYRCWDTKIDKCSSTDLQSALNEIESSDEYKWFYSQSEGKVYLSRPKEISTDNPICVGTGIGLFKGNDRSKTLKICGIETKYIVFNIDKTTNSEVVDCKSVNAKSGGAFTYNEAIGSSFIRCEASRCANGSLGDGFNGHSSNTGDIHSKQTTVSIIDCWSHDNQDDGYSDHERCEATLSGGLYEYNGKAGITPSFGAHCTCYNVYSRKNYNGFYCIGGAEESEGGMYTQLICYNCVAEDNNRHSSFRNGFLVQGNKNKVTLINCMSIGHNGYGYKMTDASNIMELINCKSLNDSSVKDTSTGRFIIKNGEIVN